MSDLERLEDETNDDTGRRVVSPEEAIGTAADAGNPGRDTDSGELGAPGGNADGGAYRVRGTAEEAPARLAWRAPPQEAGHRTRRTGRVRAERCAGNRRSRRRRRRR